jgi:hypothetical protein
MTSASVSRVVVGLSTSRGGSSCLHLDPAIDSIKLTASSQFVFPPLPTPKMLSSVSLDAPPALVSSAFGFGSFGTFVPNCSGGAGLTLHLRPKGSTQPIFTPPPSSWVAELGEKLCSSSLVLPISKPFQKYYRKSRESRPLQLDDDLLVESLAAMRSPVSFTAEEAAAMPPVKVSAGTTDCVKKGFLQRGFLNPSLTLKVSTHSSLIESVGLSSTRESKDNGGNGLSQSQKWLVGFDPSGEVVVWEQDDEIWDGELGGYTYPLGVLPPSMALDWEVDSVEGEDPSLVTLDALEEEFFEKVRLHARSPKAGGRF